jgi:hypothetical protein
LRFAGQAEVDESSIAEEERLAAFLWVNTASRLLVI